MRVKLTKKSNIKIIPSEKEKKDIEELFKEVVSLFEIAGLLIDIVVKEDRSEKE